jgi:exodeoxyribonuclease VII large subunit
MKPWMNLSDLMGGVRRALEAGFNGHTFRIIAETTDVKIYHNRQYAFLNLVEKQGTEIAAAASAVLWREHFHLIKEFENITGITFEQNLQVVLEVEIQFHERYGLRLNIIDIDTAYTLGKMEQEREKVLRKLAFDVPHLVWLEDGDYVSANHLLNKSLVMQRVALIAAPGSDGRRDFLKELEQNTWNIAYTVEEFPASVQGQNAARELLKQLNTIVSRCSEFDVIAMVRGGGSNTDLTAFDDYDLAKCIADCPKPVLTGIGHDRNISVADVVGHTMLKTPTRCAAAITEHNLAFLGWLQDGQTRIGNAAARFFENGKQQAQDASRRLKTAASWLLESEKNKLLQAEKHLDMLQPSKTLEMGYALISKNGHIVTSCQQIMENDTIKIRFSDGYSHALITPKNDN